MERRRKKKNYTAIAMLSGNANRDLCLWEHPRPRLLRCLNALILTFFVTDLGDCQVCLEYKAGCPLSQLFHMALKSFFGRPRKKVDHLSDDEESSSHDEVRIAIPKQSPTQKRGPNSPSVRSSNLKVFVMKAQLGFCFSCIAMMLLRQFIDLSGLSISSDFSFFSPTDVCVEYGGKSLEPYSAPGEKSKVKTIHLIGERHQGTKWITAELEKCFQHAVKVEAALNNRHKHWFQQPELENRDAVVIAVFRNIYSWVRSMNYVRPHHAPRHFNIEWDEFVTRPWTLRGLKNFTTYFPTKEGTMTRESSPCWQHFLPNEMEPCLESERLSMVNYSHFDSNEVQYIPELAAYELRLDGSGRPYDSIVDMRADKIRNFLEVKSTVHSFYPVQYEHMMHHGVEELISTLERDLQIQRSHLCQLHPPKPPKPVRFPPGYLDWMREHVDWEAEGLIGYSVDDIDPTCTVVPQKQ